MRREGKTVRDRNAVVAIRRKDRMVQPRQSYAQVVTGSTRTKRIVVIEQLKEKEGTQQDTLKDASRNGAQPNEKEDVALCMRDKMDDQYNEMNSIEFSPREEEITWLDGSMVAMVKSVPGITNIQELLDVDGGLITISPLGGQEYY
ncbi:hypothetical protein SLE2022_143240 [Rubroshorea leprosula]